MTDEDESADLNESDAENGVGRPWIARAGSYVAQGFREHRRYLGISAATFAVGFLGGIALFLTGVDLPGLLGLDGVEALDARGEAFTVENVALSNSVVFFALILGAAFFALPTLAGLVLAGSLFGFLAAHVAATEGVASVLLTVLLHRTLEFPALWIAGALALRAVHVLAGRIRGTLAEPLDRGDFYRTLAVLFVGWLLLVAAAVIEVHVVEEFV